MARYILLATLIFFTVAPVAAQDRKPIFKETVKDAVRLAPIRVTISTNFFLPGPANESPEAAAIRERARRMIYELAIRECAIAKEIFGEECRLDNVKVNINARASVATMPEGQNINSSITLQIGRPQ